jgi:hypothetical protein
VYGTHQLDLMRPTQLLLPTAVDDSTPPAVLTDPILDSFTCYRVRQSRGAPRFTSVDGVVLDDGLGTSTVTVRRPALWCLPTNVSGASPLAPTHSGELLCYDYGARGRGREETFANNVFGPEQLRLQRKGRVCVPATPGP